MRRFLALPLLLVACAPGSNNETSAAASANQNATTPSAAIHWVSLAQKEAIPSETAPDVSALITGDFDNDGKADVVLAHPSDLRTFLGTGSGPLNALAQGPIDSSRFPNAHLLSCLAADIDGDKNLDLIGLISEPDATTPSWTLVSMKGGGDGTFDLPVVITSQATAIDYVVADFDADKHADILLRTATDDATVLFGTADFTFEAPVATSLPPMAGSDVQMKVADVNGDGQPDIVFLDSNNAVADTYLNQGGRVPPLEGTIAYAQKPDPALDLALADMNGDKLADLLVLGKTSLERFDSQTVTAAADTDGGATPTVDYAKPVSSALAGQARIEHIADFDGDSQLDAFITNADGSGVLARSVSGAAWKPNLGTADSTFKSNTKLAFGDFDGDGREDVVVLDDQSKTTSLTVLHATSTTTTNPTTTTEQAQPGDSTSEKLPTSDDPSNGWKMSENPVAAPPASSTSATETGGCSAAPGSASWLAIALAMLFVGAQRKKGKTC